MTSYHPVMMYILIPVKESSILWIPQPYAIIR